MFRVAVAFVIAFVAGAVPLTAQHAIAAAERIESGADGDIPSYRIAYIKAEGGDWTDWTAPCWSNIEALYIDHFHRRSDQHRPTVDVKVRRDTDALYVIYRVRDEYVVAIHTEPQSNVSQDSCVEFFVQPTTFGGYFNFEMNCIGAIRAEHRPDSTFILDSDPQVHGLDSEDLKQIEVVSSLIEPIPRQSTEPAIWMLAIRIPFNVFKRYVGPLEMDEGATWRANFYKCADGSSRPHWASWAPLGKVLNFHAPERFGVLIFERPHDQGVVERTQDDASVTEEDGQS